MLSGVTSSKAEPFVKYCLIRSLLLSFVSRLHRDEGWKTNIHPSWGCEGFVWAHFLTSLISKLNIMSVWPSFCISFNSSFSIFSNNWANIEWRIVCLTSVLWTVLLYLSRIKSSSQWGQKQLGWGPPLGRSSIECMSKIFPWYYVNSAVWLWLYWR